ncbi:MAG: antibiotic biosynthesis monooxygenase family protein [Desulfomicrobium sp.]|nr:antibiotic biosynthesis monooxygenase family protein [Desulfomicrobium sp.]
MIFVIFEVVVHPEAMDKYLLLATELKQELEKTPGFIRAQRFQSIGDECKLLSLSVWENEQAVDQWRQNLAHRLSQRQGHYELFASYTLSVAQKISQYTQEERSQAPQDSQEFLHTSFNEKHHNQD